MTSDVTVLPGARVRLRLPSDVPLALGRRVGFAAAAKPFYAPAVRRPSGSAASATASPHDHLLISALTSAALN